METRQIQLTLNEEKMDILSSMGSWTRIVGTGTG